MASTEYASVEAYFVCRERVSAMIIAIAAGGAIGAVLRYLIAVRVYSFLGIDLPYGTLTVNLLGTFLLGIVLGLVEHRGALGPELRSFLTIGLLGGMTTFSTFTYESWEFARDGEPVRAALNVLLSLVGAFVLFTAGYGLMRTWGR